MAAMLPAERAQRVMLPDAAAVLGFEGNISTSKVLKVFTGPHMVVSIMLTVERHKAMTNYSSFILKGSN